MKAEFPTAFDTYQQLYLPFYHWGMALPLRKKSSKDIRCMAVEEIIKPLAILRLDARLETGPFFHMLR